MTVLYTVLHHPLVSMGGAGGEMIVGFRYSIVFVPLTVSLICLISLFRRRFGVAFSGYFDLRS